MSGYSNIQPIGTPVLADRQTAKRHYGVHPYFARRPFNVVRKYILHYSREGDCVVDPFGGSGVTAIEAYLENRHGIQNDINPLANFIAIGIHGLHRGDINDYDNALGQIQSRCEAEIKKIPTLNDQQLAHLRSKVCLPENVALPSNSDVRQYHDLFSPRQLVAIALLRAAIDKLAPSPAKDALLLAWSATLTKLNKTFLSAKGRADSRGGSSIFSIYRYKVAKYPIELPVWETFRERAENVRAAKLEIDRAIEVKARTGAWTGRFDCYSCDVEQLGDKLAGKADYIFTDPPYGGHISYLDLSTLWNAWLDGSPSQSARQSELIVGGELKLSEEWYVSKLRRSIQSCLRILKNNRWLSIVFQHWNVAYFEAILSTAAESGGDLKAAVSQVGDPIWSMHKKKGAESVIAGELILSFFKSGATVQARKPVKFDVSEEIRNILLRSGDVVYGEQIFNSLVIEAWQKSAIRSLAISKAEFIEIVRACGWEYNDNKHYWTKQAKGGRRQLALFVG